LEGRSIDVDWQTDLDRWLAPFVAALRHKMRARMCPAYIAGLIGPGDRKSVQPMAAHAAEVGHDQLHHFVAAGVWDSAPLEAAPLKKADGLTGDKAGFLIIDDTALPKKGDHSVGVAPQYASSLGKTANYQSLVSVTLAPREVPVMVGLRLFLPESWTDNPERMEQAGVPKDRQIALTKLKIALEEIDRVIASDTRFGCVLADSGYGSSGSFRQVLPALDYRAYGTYGRPPCMPGDEVWLVGERRSTGELKYYLSTVDIQNA
jgi:SRSO17 transposase